MHITMHMYIKTQTHPPLGEAVVSLFTIAKVRSPMCVSVYHAASVRWYGVGACLVCFVIALTCKM